MKILHTSDWHIGKHLYKQTFEQDFSLFLDFLLQTIEQKEIDVLLISGDIFDYSNPSTTDRKVYYQFLARLANYNIQTILTGGNHDGVNMLNAPQEILSAMNIHVIGGATEQIKDELIEIRNQNDEVECVVAAVPFLRDRDLRNRKTDQVYDNRAEAIRDGIYHHYRELMATCETLYDETVPLIAMGHLYAVGIHASESERDIHVGNAAAVDEQVFAGYDYVALGHIHKPQIVGNNEMIRYCGSPIAFSFSERYDEKQLILLDTETLEPQIVPIPKHRELIRIEGNLQEIREELEQFENNYLLPAFVELIIHEQYSDLINLGVEQLKEEYQENEQLIILNSKPHTLTKTESIAEINQHIQDVKPVSVFTERLEQEDLSTERKQDLIDLFHQLLEEVQGE